MNDSGGTTSGESSRDPEDDPSTTSGDLPETNMDLVHAPNPWLPAYGFQLQHHSPFQPTQEDLRANDPMVVQRVDFLETILEETSDDLQSDSDRSGTTYWLGSDSETESVIHIRANHGVFDEKPDGSGSECNSVVPKKRRRRNGGSENGSSLDQRSMSPRSSRSSRSSGSSRSSSLLQFESLERTCATLSPSSYSFDSLEYANRSSNRFDNTSPDSLEQDYDRTIPNGFAGETFGKIRPYRSFESLDTYQKEDDVRQRLCNGFAPLLYTERNQDLSRSRAKQTKRSLWRDEYDDDDNLAEDLEDDEDQQEDPVDRCRNDLDRFDDRLLVFAESNGSYSTALDCRNTIDLREIGIESKRDALFDLKSGQASSSGSWLLQSGLNIAGNMGRTGCAGQQGWSKSGFNFRFTDKSQSAPSLPGSAFGAGLGEEDFYSATSSITTVSSAFFENYNRVASVPVDLYLCGDYSHDDTSATRIGAVPSECHEMADVEMMRDGATPKDDVICDGVVAPRTSDDDDEDEDEDFGALLSSVRTQDPQDTMMVRQEERKHAPREQMQVQQKQVTSTVKTQDRRDNVLEIAMAMESDIDAVVDEAIKQFKREVEEAAITSTESSLSQRSAKQRVSRKIKNNASYELAQQLQVDETNFRTKMPSCQEVDVENGSPKPSPRRRVVNNASYELAQQCDYIRVLQGQPKPFHRMDACDEEPSSSRLKVAELVEEMSKNKESSSKGYSKSAENVSTGANSEVVANHVGPRESDMDPSEDQDSLLSQIKKNSDFFSLPGENGSVQVEDEVDYPCLESKSLVLTPVPAKSDILGEETHLREHPDCEPRSSAKKQVTSTTSAELGRLLDDMIPRKKSFLGEYYPEKTRRHSGSPEEVEHEVKESKVLAKQSSSKVMAKMDSKSSVRAPKRRDSPGDKSIARRPCEERSSGDFSDERLTASTASVTATMAASADSEGTKQPEEENPKKEKDVATQEYNVHGVRCPPPALAYSPQSGNPAAAATTTAAASAGDTNRRDNDEYDNNGAPVRQEMSTAKCDPVPAMANPAERKKGGLGGFLQRFSRLRFSGRSKVPRSEVHKKSEAQVNRAKLSGQAEQETTGSKRKKEPDYIIIPLHPPEEERKREEELRHDNQEVRKSAQDVHRVPSNVSTNGRPPVSSKPPLPPQPPRATALGSRPAPSGGVATRRRAATDLGNPAAIEMAKARTMQAGTERPVGLLETDLDAAEGSEGVATPAAPGKKTRSLLNLNHTRAGREAGEAATRAPQSPGGRTPVDVSVASINQRPHKSMEFLLDKENLHFVKPPENELQKVGERVPSEHELRVQRSLQRLNVPDWFKNSPAARDGFRLKRHSDASQHSGWRALGSKTTSLSSLSSSSNRQPTTAGVLLSPSPTPPVFSRWSTSLLNSAGSSPASSARSSFNHRQPYLGWRSQERLTNPRTPAERLAQGILPQLQAANKQQQTTNQQLEVRNSIKEVTSAIVHYVQSGQEVGGGGRLSPRSRAEDWDDRGGARSTSPRGSVKLCWMESSFVGSRPVDSPETPMSLATETEGCAGCNATASESCSCVDSATSGLFLDLTPTREGGHYQGSASLCPSPSSSANYHHQHSRQHHQRHYRESARSALEVLGGPEERPSYYVGELVRRKSEGSDTIPSRMVGRMANFRHRRVSFDNAQDSGAAVAAAAAAAAASSEKTVRCRNNKCNNAASVAEARKTYKSCHNCTCLYCSRECRRAHWQRHRRTCLHSRAGTLCRQVLSSAKEDPATLKHVSTLARRGYVSHGRGAVKCFFTSPEAAEKFVENGFVDLGEPTYMRWSDLLPSEMGAELYAEATRLCKAYNPDTRLVLYVAVCVVSEVPTSGPVRWERQLVSRCAKVRLDASCRPAASASASPQGRQQTSSPCNITREMDSPETLVLTSQPGTNGQNTPRKAREISFTNIQRQLRLRGVSLRRHFPQVYRKLCSYVDGSVDKFAPVTIYPRDQASGKSFMCIIMLDAEPERLQLLPTDSSRVRTVDISVEQV
ncbi:uncharacterized protein LOC105698999 isoform X3 [Orussus abietinus]|uniref:uncharacterized protein LOC105698999 isoform X3 n=1 Tax=Orussus abietinus TaxID=222816 RepID=UPI0006264D4E|nr:uncharacterized protein LOC105698999 isoform X3 [Orussus abietinus]